MQAVTPRWRPPSHSITI
jgi:hypothetical protein